MIRRSASSWCLVLLCLLMAFPAWAEMPVVDGTAYLLLPKDFSTAHGVWRLNEAAVDARTDDPVVASKPYHLFRLDLVGDKVSGFAVDQKNSLYLLGQAGNTAFKAQADGWLPSDLQIPNDSPLYVDPLPVRLYERWAFDAKGKAVATWKQNVSYQGLRFDFVLQALTPDSHKYLPMWDGQTGLKHPLGADRWIMPNNWGFLPTWAYGTPVSAWPARAFDGLGGRPAVAMLDAPINGTTKDRLAFAPALKRGYSLRLGTLGLYKTVDGAAVTSPALEAADLLPSRDLSAREYYGHADGSSMLPGGDLPAMEIARHLSNAVFLPSADVRRYAFTPAGKAAEPYGTTGAALRRIDVGGNARNYPLDRTTVRNADSLTLDRQAKLENLTWMGVATRFDRTTDDPPDYLFGSVADLFTLQDSWWGIGGVAYEWNRETSILTRWDYLEADSTKQPRPSGEQIGRIEGDLDAIAVDGKGYLYALFNELVPAVGNGGVIRIESFDAGNPAAYRDRNNLAPEVGPWTRVSADGQTATVETPKNGDISVVKVRQYVNKRLRRYSLGAGNTLGAAEERGVVEAGFDYLTRVRTMRDGAIVWLSSAWEPLKQADRLTAVRAGLAIVQLPKRPTMYNQDPQPPSVCLADRQSLAAPVNEGASLEFKVEGYKPFIGNERKGLKDVGICGDLGRTRVNLIAGPGGEYNFDEDGDGVKSGFPSSLFETDSVGTKISWYVDWVDQDSEDKVLAHIAVASAARDSNGEFAIAFPHPGNYRVWAKVDYRYFDYTSMPEQSRPADLKNAVKARTVTSGKRLVRVQSAPNVKSPENYVTNIRISPVAGAFDGVATAADTLKGKIVDLPEDGAPGFLAVSCDVQFVRDANLRTTTQAPLETFSGVGVWHYDSYVDLLGVKMPKRGGMVYNYREPRNPTDGLAARVDPAKYNPGWNKPDDQAKMADNGTRVDASPNEGTSRDLEFVRWELFVYPVYDKAPAALKAYFAKGGTYARGIPVASGSFAGAACESLGERKYRLTAQVPAEALAAFGKTPVDPQTWKLRAEITYPRVTWTESAAPGETGVQYRSMIPDNEPIHVVTTVPHTRFPGGFADAKGNSCFAAGDAWNLRYRDKTLVSPSQIEPGILVHTTGDPVPSATMTYVVFDNNPNAEFKGFGIKYEFPKTVRDLANKVWQNVAPAVEPALGNLPEKPEYMNDDNYRAAATYAVDVTEYGQDGMFTPGNPLQNWVGTLTYAIQGSVVDGTDLSGKSPAHPFDYPLATGAKGIETVPGQLVRIDNDPPSIRVSLVSQADNRRWEVGLKEGLTDLEPAPTDVSKLASCSLELASFRLDDGTPLGNGTTTAQIGGCCDVPALLGAENQIVDLVSVASGNALLSAYLPRVKRSGRLMVMVEVDENVDCLDLASATVTLIEPATGRSLLPEGAAAISLARAFNQDSNPNLDLPSPRARYVIDLPMKVEVVQPQLLLTVAAQDAAGNRRGLIIPIYVADSGFDARILESKEHRKQ